MSLRVGITTLKLANKMASNARKRRTGRVAPVACEALEERWSKDSDVNRELTKYNEYEGIRSGLELTRVLNSEAEVYSEKRRSEGGRGLRDTASIGFACIVKPEMGEFSKLPLSEQKRFLRDSREFLDSIFDSKRLASVIHVDELCPHIHNFYSGTLSDGTLSVDKLVNPRVWKRINTEYVSFMAEKGWEVEPPDLYDEERAAKDEDYKEERKAKRRRNGREAEEYKREQRERLAKENAEKVMQAADEYADRIIYAANRKLEEADEGYEELEIIQNTHVIGKRVGTLNNGEPVYIAGPTVKSLANRHLQNEIRSKTMTNMKNVSQTFEKGL